MANKQFPFDFKWDIEKYKSNYDLEHWELCKKFMEIHKTKYPEQKLAHLTEAFYQIGVYGSSYDSKTTRMVNALSIEVLDHFLQLHPGTIKHPFNRLSSGVKGSAKIEPKEPKKDEKEKPSQSIWDVSVDTNIVVKVLAQSELKSLLKGFVNIYDIRKASTMNDNKVTILEESFRRSKFGPCHWHREITANIFAPVQLTLKWKSSVLAEAEGKDDSTLKNRIAQAVLSKLALFSSGIEAKWNYYRDGRMHDIFENPNPRRSHLYKILRRSEFKSMEEITSFVDTFANSDSFGEIIFGMDFSNQDKNKILDYIEKSWSSKLTHRTVNKPGLKGKGEVTHMCIYQVRNGDELKRWLVQTDGENLRYRLVPPGNHRRAGACDSNVKEVLTFESNNVLQTTQDKNQIESTTSKDIKASSESKVEKTGKPKETIKNKNDNKDQEKSTPKTNTEVESRDPESLENIFKGFVLFYNSNKDSKIDTDDWFSVLCESFNVSEYGALDIIMENIRPLRTKCTLKWKEMTLATAEGLTDTQAKTAATLQLISKLEPFTYIIQAKEDYFCDGKVPSFIENPDENKSDLYRVYKRQDLPSYYTIFQTIDKFVEQQTYGEIIFGEDFTWDLKNEIMVYLKAKGMDYRYFTLNNQNPPTHMAVFHSIKPEELKKHLLENGGENIKYKLIPPTKTELTPSRQDSPAKKPEVSEKPVEVPPLPQAEAPPPPPPPVISTSPKPGGKRKIPEDEEKKAEPEPDIEINKIQINLKKFKKDKVEFPEDTGGDFPGLILWLGIKKNSQCQKSLYIILMESFKMSKYGELVVEESEESVWGRKESLKKCVIKSGRKVLAVGLGETKTEAKNSAALQVLRQLRKHCYAIQAKESYFKDGKAPPYDINPDPKKEHIYRMAKKEKLKDKSSIIKFVDTFSKKVSEGEVIFGDEFSYEEREAVAEHCRKINLSHRLMRCQSVNKGQHSHIAIYHQRPLPAIKATLVDCGGENDFYRLIAPGEKITSQTNDNDLWPDTLENCTQEPSNVNQALATVNGQDNSKSEKAKEDSSNSTNKINNFSIAPPGIDNIPVAEGPIPSSMPVAEMSTNFNTLPPNLASVGPQPFGPPPPFFPPQPFQEMPLVFGPQPMVYLPMQENMPLHFNNIPPPFQVPFENMLMPPGEFMTGMEPQVLPHLDAGASPQIMNDGTNTMPPNDLRQELDKKREQGQQNKNKSDWQDRKVTRWDKAEDTWSRKVFVEEQDQDNQDLRNVLSKKGKFQGDFQEQGPSGYQDNRKFTQDNNRARGGRGRFMRGRGRGGKLPSQTREFSSERKVDRISPDRRSWSPDRRERSPSFERRFPGEQDRGGFRRNRFRSRSPTTYRDKRSPSPRLRRSISPRARYRDLWDNISHRLANAIFMFKYVKQDSTVETDPFALLRATRSLDFNVDFDFVSCQIAIEEWQVSVELVTDDTDMHPLVGEGVGHTESDARLIAARHAVDTIEKACRVIEPNFSYFADGGVPDFIARRNPMKTHIYEIIQNLDPSQPVDRVTIDCMLNAFIQSDMEDIFFLTNDFSYIERSMVVNMADKKNLWWRLFGRRHPEAAADDIVSTQHVCVFKQKTGAQIMVDLVANRGRTDKYTLVSFRDNIAQVQAQAPRAREWTNKGKGRGRGRNRDHNKR